jgi:hypothetical protein
MVEAWVSELKNKGVADNDYCAAIFITGILVSRLRTVFCRSIDPNPNPASTINISFPNARRQDKCQNSTREDRNAQREMVHCTGDT